jgi:molybdenum cofactor cytidylyltransferase
VETRKIGCVVMAAGSATRFGADKLSAELNGKTLLRRALEAVAADAFSAVVVVTQHADVFPLISARGFTPVHNPHPELGASHTIALGLAALEGCDAILFQVADQPLLRRESEAALVDFYRAHPENIVALGHGGVRGNPCLFPAKYFPELRALTGDHGGNTVIRRHEEALLLYEVPARELSDVDTPEALRALDARTAD